jgi:hypothetical protein
MGFNSAFKGLTLVALGSRSETPGKFCNVVLEENGKDQLD